MDAAQRAIENLIDVPNTAAATTSLCQEAFGRPARLARLPFRRRRDFGGCVICSCALILRTLRDSCGNLPRGIAG